MQQYQFAGAFLLVAVVVTQPVSAAESVDVACGDAAHVADSDVAHTADADTESWIDPATADLVANPPEPRIEREIRDNGAGKGLRVDIPKETVARAVKRCPAKTAAKKPSATTKP